MVLDTLEPGPLWSIFSSICSIPHVSHHESALAAWICERAAGRGIAVMSDSAGNVVLRRPASVGHEWAPGLILQAHLDMVGQASGAAHDFGRDPILPRRSEGEPDWLEASDTTLGADDGIGVAAALAFIEADDLQHGPLECLFTVNEEDGMAGARALAPSALQGSFLLNLDHEDDAELCIGCAGTVRIRARRELSELAEELPAGSLVLRVSVAGLQGGHSGADIHLGRANASRVLAELILQSGERIPWRLLSFEGGSAANAIPREAEALVALPAASKPAWDRRFARSTAELEERFRASDPGLGTSVVENRAGTHGLPVEQSRAVVASLLALPNGLIALSQDMPGMVQSSCNLGIVSLTPEPAFRLEVMAMVRSSNETERQDIAAQVEQVFASIGASTSRPSAAPAWSPEPGNVLVALASQTYRELFGREALVMSTHGGLECGLFRPVFPQWNMLSIGPLIRHPHSPREAVNIPSVERFWRFLTALAERLALEGPDSAA